ncbi:MAG: bifunctional riboflavin kinase/FMN adenylyltransferase [Rhodobacterales bacterium]|nr:MAG: bifunctional riboflavin kinase/FMN adenylyltransferase [Rhodobacterales bacterium]
MKILRATSTTDPALRGAATAIGNFDGVHLGHQSVIELARKEAARLGAPLGVMTFEPHPREIFVPDAPPFRLMNAQARAHRLEKLGVDVLYELPFSRDLADLTASAFAEEIIARGLGLSHVVVGADFRFGRDRGGNAASLRACGDKLGFGVTMADLLAAGEMEISSTAIRRALSEGRPGDAAQMLGHWHRIEGPVIHGEKRGRELGYPTANIAIDGLHPPRFGVYAVTVDILDGAHAGSYIGAASIGVRPMFDGDTPNCEVFLFDFDGDLYGARLSVGLVSYLRGEETFDSLDALIDQMGRDCARAREILRDA